MHVRAITLGSLLATACEPEAPDGCDGGGEPSARIGVEEIIGEFVPYEDGDQVPVVGTGSGAALEFAYEVEGLDSDDTISVVMRLGRLGEGTTDYLDNADLRCVEPGPARYGAAAPWPTSWPDPTDLDGSTIIVQTVFTDIHDVSADVSIDLVVDANR